MKQTLQSLFDSMPDHQLPNELFGKIMTSVDSEVRSSSKRRLALTVMVLLASIGALIPAFQMVISDFWTSGFVEISSIIFSDISAVSANWHNFVFALIEAFPVTTFAITLGTVFVFLFSLKIFINTLFIWTSTNIFNHKRSNMSFGL